MKRLLLVSPLILLAAFPACEMRNPPRALQDLPPVEVYFSPKGGCTEAVVNELNSATKSIMVQAYSFTSAPIAEALVEAHKRGVKVEVILDKSQETEKYSEADFLANMGVPVRIDAQHAIAHNKIMVLDDATVITGSFNFTKSAEQSNAENLLVIRSAELAGIYAGNWLAHADHSQRYAGREKGYSETHRATEKAEFAPSAVSAGAKGYVASRNSAVFHRANCRSAAKISAENAVRYASRDAALQAGKKPCQECKP